MQKSFCEKFRNASHARLSTDPVLALNREFVKKKISSIRCVFVLFSVCGENAETIKLSNDNLHVASIVHSLSLVH